MGVYTSIKEWTEIMGEQKTILENNSFWWNSLGEENIKEDATKKAERTRFKTS